VPGRNGLTGRTAETAQHRPRPAQRPPGTIAGRPRTALDRLTKHVTTTVSGLAPEQLVRGRVRAIGGVAGAWSAEVVGRAQ
jgi:hypothetical protein